jgi:hypothetical protein
VPEEPALPPLAPVRSSNANDGNYFVNCMHSDGTVSSGVAYYSNLNPGGNVNQQPDDYVDVAHGTNYVWEQTGSGEQNPSSNLMCLFSANDVRSRLPQDQGHCALVYLWWCLAGPRGERQRRYRGQRLPELLGLQGHWYIPVQRRWVALRFHVLRLLSCFGWSASPHSRSRGIVTYCNG